MNCQDVRDLLPLSVYGDLAGAEQMLQTKYVAIECRRAVHVVSVDGNLSDLREHGCLRNRHELCLHD